MVSESLNELTKRLNNIAEDIGTMRDGINKGFGALEVSTTVPKQVRGCLKGMLENFLTWPTSIQKEVNAALVIAKTMEDASTRKDEGTCNMAQSSPSSSDNEPHLSELRNWVKAYGREHNFPAQLEAALDRIAGLENVLNKQEHPSEIPVFDNTELVNKLSTRISAWRLSGLERGTHAEALDYVEFVTSHLPTAKLGSLAGWLHGRFSGEEKHYEDLGSTEKKEWRTDARIILEVYAQGVPYVD